MNEGRRCRVRLLDNRKLDIIIQPRLYGQELLDIVASHCRLKEKQFFGLAVLDDNNNHHLWLQSERRILEQELVRKQLNRQNKDSPNTLQLIFLVKFYVESITYLKYAVTVELFYLQARESVFREEILVDNESCFELAALALQVSFGSYTSDKEACEHLKKLAVIPTSVLRQHPSISYCEEQILLCYRKLVDTSRGQAIVQYMTVVEHLPTYGIHYYEVRDKSALPWWLGVGFKGLYQYDSHDRQVARKVFQWKHLENLYFRDKKFSLELRDAGRVAHTLSSFNLYEEVISEPQKDTLSNAVAESTTQVSVSRRVLAASNVSVYAWFTQCPILTHAIWAMCVAQHKFYLDQPAYHKNNTIKRQLSEIASELTNSVLVLRKSEENLSYSYQTPKTPNREERARLFNSVSQTSDCREMAAALAARKAALEDKLSMKILELKKMCLREAELIGECPVEYPLSPGEQVPAVRRRIGTSFALPHNLLNKLRTNEEEIINNLELELEIQKRIVMAADRLVADATARKVNRKQRKITYYQAVNKLQDLEKKLDLTKKALAKTALANSKQHQNRINSTGSNVLRKKPRPLQTIQGYNNPAMSVDSVDGGIVNADSNSTNSHNQMLPDMRYSNRSISPPPLPSPSVFNSPALLHCRFIRRTQSTNNSASSLSVSSSRTSTPSPYRQNSTTDSSSNVAVGAYGSQQLASPPQTTTTNNTQVGYIPHRLYMTQSSYRLKQYPTFSTKKMHGSYGDISPPYDKSYDATTPEDGSAVYSVQNQIMGRHIFPSLDELQQVGLPSAAALTYHHSTAANDSYDTSVGGNDGLADNFARYGSLDRSSVRSASPAVLPTNPVKCNYPPVPEYVNVNTLGAVNLTPRSSSPYYGSLDRTRRSLRISRDFGMGTAAAYASGLCGGGDTYRATPEAGIPEIDTQPPIDHFPADSTNCWQNANQQSIQALARRRIGNVNSAEEKMDYPGDRIEPMPEGEADRNGRMVQRQKEWYETDIDQANQRRANKVRSVSTSSMLSDANYVNAYVTSYNPIEASTPDARQLVMQSPITTPLHALSPGASALTTPPLSPALLEQLHLGGLNSPTSPNQVLVSVGQFVPYREETKPYELSDYYKYSTKIRRQTSNSSSVVANTSAGSVNSGTISPCVPVAATENIGSKSDSGSSRLDTSGMSRISYGELQPEKVGDNFTEEMLAWYEDQEPQSRKATLV